ncbi:MAG: YceI family protein [Xanthomonadales bacterium]|nr:YceI family protein [Xanthomonadales bacterium]
MLLLLAAAGAAAEEGLRRWAAERSHAEFEARRFGVLRSSGRFPRLGGGLRREGGRVVIEATIEVAELEGLSGRERRYALGPDFFDALNHPRIRFRSDPLPPEILALGGALPGWLSIRGLSRRASFELAPPACPDAGRGCPLEARGEIRRSAFGLGRGAVGLGDRVALRLVVWLEPEPGP